MKNSIFTVIFMSLFFIGCSNKNSVNTTENQIVGNTYKYYAILCSTCTKINFSQI